MVNNQKLQVIAVFIIAVALVLAAAVYPYIQQLFVSPLTTTFTSQVHLPVVVKNCRFIPDPRFGIAEHNLKQMLLLGFPDDGRYHSVQHTLPEKTDTVRHLRPVQRDHPSTWLLGTYDVVAERWVYEEEFRRFVREHPDVDYVVGNELGVGTPVGDNNVTPEQYAQWYDAAWNLIKAENPDARVGPFAPVNMDAINRLRSVWAEYQSLTGQPMQVDFFPIHWHVDPGEWVLEEEVAGITEWVTWLDSYNGRGWVWTGEPAFWLTEYSLSEWSHPWVEPDEVLRFMRGFTTWLKTNTLNINVFVWWYSGRNTSLIYGKTPTPLGRLYLELALSG